MRIKRYFGKTIRDAIRQVREEQGPDAVILSNREVEGGIEIIAAIDFEEVLLTDDGGTVAVSPQAPHSASPSAAASSARVREPATRKKAGARQKPAAESQADARTLDAMRREIRNLRGIMEHQISGLVWGDIARRNPQQARLLRRLLQLELSPKLCQRIVDEMSRKGDGAMAWRNALGLLAHKLPVTEDDIISQGGIVALVGATGVGKTTTAAKLAARFAVRHGSRHVALVTTDNYRVGAQEQLRAYARILDVPMRIATNRAELRDTLNSVSDRKLVIIDTAGMSQRDIRLTEQFSMLKAGSSRIHTYLVLAATTRLRGMNEVIRAFGRMHIHGCILTKVDEVDSLGNALSVLISHQLPVAYVSDGQRVPEDLYAARAHSLVSRSVALLQESRRMLSESGGAAAVAQI